MKKILISIGIMILSVLIISSALAASPYDWPNMLGPATSQAVNSLTLGWVNIKYDDYKEGLFYPISQWEFDICTAGVTSDLTAQGLDSQLGDSTDIKDLYGPITAAINAKKYVYQVNGTSMTLYEISWYVQPRPNTGEIKYSVYMKTNTGDKFYPQGLKDLISDPAQGATGDFISYLNESGYVEAGIESAGNVVFSNNIVTNPFGENYG